MNRKIRKDFTGRKIGRLLVIRLTSSDLKNNKKIYYDCICDCGTQVTVRQDSLKSQTLSCGCLQIEHAIRLGKSRAKKEFEACKKEIYQRYKYRSMSNNIIFSISFKKFVSLIESECYYCGDYRSNTIKKGNTTYQYNGLDRVNPKLGYSLDNIRTCCVFCNYAKSDWTQDEFYDKVKKIYHRRIINE